MVRILKVRQVATWVTMSCMTVLLADNLLGWLPANFGVMLYGVVALAVGVAALCQISICFSFLWVKLGLGPVWREWAAEATREEAERFH